ncbi:hypothetical protein NP233_g2501 [Leucocoprinus birnbaumii]|uniref:Cytochrome P450 n=1 Tax=Leucocoprinus birnbaumii TaxID=56174 RepID=A0AAD5YX83_9AGAR|nr:hypothetical protein NP233_g2501 [Leucocoprinus birnbaumii]
MSISRVSTPLGATVALYLIYKAYDALNRYLTSPMRHLPGPPSSSILLGSMKEMMLTDPNITHVRLVEEHGTTFKFRAAFGDEWLFTADVKAISYILKRDAGKWQKPTTFARNLIDLLGPGLVLVDSDVHRKQLKDMWSSQIQQNNGEAKQIDVLSGLSRATLEIIGETGFGYKFDSLSEDGRNELHEAFKIMFKSGAKPGLIRLIKSVIPAGERFIPSDFGAEKETERAKATMNRIGKALLKERESSYDPQISEQEKYEVRDILSLLVRANAAGANDHRLPEDQVLAQIPTFIVAGHETTSTTTAWALFSLAQDLAMQSKLRDELLAVATGNPSMEELNSLPFLDAVARETFRLHAAAPSTMRLPVEDDVLPLQTPVVDTLGNKHAEIRVRKGQVVLMSLATVNQLQSIWGEDAGKFNPERWKSPPEAAMAIPGVWGNVLTFLGGPRACIGYRFAIIEMKALLFTLLRAFEFTLAVPTSDIIKQSEFVIRPHYKGDSSNSLPLLVRPVAD